MESVLSVNQIADMFTYDPKAGEIWWIEKGKGKIKKKAAGTIVSNGYKAVIIKGKRYYNHRIAWALTHKSWPKDQIDHINGVKTDNRICNLREATNSQNGKNFKIKVNNTSGMTGVVWCKQTQKWRVLIKVDGKTIHLGRFVSKDDAIKTRENAESLYWGDWGRACH